MAEIVNLRMARKRAVRQAVEAKAEANRTAFGLPKAVRMAARSAQSQSDRKLDGLRLEPNATGGEPDAGSPVPSPDPS
ncbi:hypothetical protein Sa4125_30880 [Aureimonas sp. SA4125]|uniref:DUF4169 family protein n=1 Tax=Aureimonas sp. SA4125 TaxID=2826993 RepID=UPI001CC45813|nr:DUF4169 family protein [Aureimonas sp. SA4125]BDA85546.1 hypothetical protein Sa4125_30880 [Aureimonas sp. SA4125]